VFEFELTRKLGFRTRAQLLREMSTTEFYKWLAYRSYKHKEWVEKTGGGKKGQMWDGW
jgi:hypothetical protein